ncbi:hypothetical protein ElyMa_003658700 [Elysia marginata]|uniref:Secreted protein n=1 Tax=Elysia marginata TaxID=1093978 RepID=A0AAV4EXF4_9GAST|nr:hypothetical protein ElyMa_003658700 [Elysia marginata]
MAWLDYSRHLLLMTVLANTVTKALASANVAGYPPDPRSIPLMTGVSDFPGTDISSSPDYNYGDYYDDEDDDHDGKDNSHDADQDAELPPSPRGIPTRPAASSGQSQGTKSQQLAQVTCAFHDGSVEPQLWNRTEGGDWRMISKTGSKRWRRRLLDDHIQCENSCFTLMEADALQPTAVKIKILGK